MRVSITQPLCKNKLMASQVNTKLARTIKKARIAKGYTQERLAELVKTSYKYIQRIEGKNPPDLRVSSLERIASALGTTAGKLLGN